MRVRGDVSSQFLTALLMALPLVSSKDVVIDVVGELISKPYIEITLNLLARFGIQVRRDGWERFTIPAGSRYQSPGSIHVEADASSASYFIALGALTTSATGQNGIKIEGAVSYTHLDVYKRQGKEVAGIEHADADLYKGRQLILTPIERTLTTQLRQAQEVWTAMGCRVVQMSPEAHDAAFAAVSHLPHLLGFALMNSTATSQSGLVGG